MDLHFKITNEEDIQYLNTLDENEKERREKYEFKIKENQSRPVGNRVFNEAEVRGFCKRPAFGQPTTKLPTEAPAR